MHCSVISLCFVLILFLVWFLGEWKRAVRARRRQLADGVRAAVEDFRERGALSRLNIHTCSVSRRLTEHWKSEFTGGGLVVASTPAGEYGASAPASVVAHVSIRVRSHSVLGRDAREHVGSSRLSGLVHWLREPQWQGQTLLHRGRHVGPQAQHQSHIHRVSRLH